MGAKSASPQTVFCERLRAARASAGLSQRELGIRAGIDAFVASARVNRYEQGVHQPDIDTAGRLAKVLDVPLAYLFADDERLAKAILGFSRMKRGDMDAMLRDLFP